MYSFYKFSFYEFLVFIHWLLQAQQFITIAGTLPYVLIYICLLNISKKMGYQILARSNNLVHLVFNVPKFYQNRQFPQNFSMPYHFSI